jgi:hypothetical protein
MAEPKTKEGALTEADLAAYGILPRQPDELTLVKSEKPETPITALPS